MPEIKSAYVVYPRVTADPVGETRAKQSMARETDINVIMAGYKQNGLLTHVNRHQGEYGEFTVIDFHEAMNTIVSAERMFETLPSEIRTRFNNDPGLFLDYVDDPANAAGMREMGLLPPEEPAPDPAPAPVPEPAPE